MTHGRQSQDARLFSAPEIKKISDAADDLRLLLSKSYGMNESLQLVSNHFKLTSRQRQFLYRCVSPPEKAAERRKKILDINRKKSIEWRAQKSKECRPSIEKFRWFSNRYQRPQYHRPGNIHRRYSPYSGWQKEWCDLYYTLKTKLFYLITNYC